MLTDNEKTVVVGRHAGLPEFNPTMESFMSHYRVSIQVCAPADPATKGGVEYAVRLAEVPQVLFRLSRWENLEHAEKI